MLPYLEAFGAFKMEVAETHLTIIILFASQIAYNN